MAEDGKIEDVFIVCTGTDDTVMRSWANGCRPFLMVGAIEDAKRDFMESCIDEK